jgi:hypothetical protein
MVLLGHVLGPFLTCGSYVVWNQQVNDYMLPGLGTTGKISSISQSVVSRPSFEHVTDDINFLLAFLLVVLGDPLHHLSDIQVFILILYFTNE